MAAGAGVSGPVDRGGTVPPPPYAGRVQKYLTLAEVAARLGVTEQRTYELVRRGELYGVKTADRGWLVAAVNLEAYLAGGPQGAAVP